MSHRRPDVPFPPFPLYLYLQSRFFLFVFFVSRLDGSPLCRLLWFPTPPLPLTSVPSLDSEVVGLNPGLRATFLSQALNAIEVNLVRSNLPFPFFPS